MKKGKKLLIFIFIIMSMLLVSCGASTTNKHTHSYSSTWKSDSTSHWHECSCGEKKDVASHTYGDWIIIKQATIAEKGSKKQVCSVCGYENVVEIPKLDHTHEYSEEYSSDSTGHWHECSCGEKDEVVAHTYGEFTVIKEATLTEKGSKKQVCSVCGYENVVEIPTLDHTHDYSDDYSSDSTGHWHECSCGEKDEVVSHTYGDWITINDSTHTEVGSKKQICSVCGYENMVEIQTKEHNYSEELSYDDDNHWYECACGDKKDVEAHNIVDKDCTICNYHVYSKGLIFTLLSDNTYEVSSIGTCKDTNVVIPSKYDGKTVTSMPSMSVVI